MAGSHSEATRKELSMLHCPVLNEPVEPWKLHTEDLKIKYQERAENKKRSCENSESKILSVTKVTNARNWVERLRQFQKRKRQKNRKVLKFLPARESLRRSSKKERREDALAPGAEEGRDKLRKAAVRSKYPMSRRYPNGGTRLRKAQSLYDEYIVI